jgi:ATP-dependent DNA helicase RecQ
MDSYGILKLNDASAKALKGEQEIFLREDILPAKSKEKLTKLKSKSKSGAGESKGDLAVDEQLFNKLKALRLSLAKEHKLAPYMVFHDTTLKEMAASKPQNLDEMSSITGVGQAKLKKYGEAFLALTS